MNRANCKTSRSPWAHFREMRKTTRFPLFPKGAFHGNAPTRRFCNCLNKLIIGMMVAFAAFSGRTAEPSATAIRWVDGTWDESGPPKGKLLTDNRGWWGPRVYTDYLDFRDKLLEKYSTGR